VWTESEFRSHVDKYIERVVSALEGDDHLSSLADAGARHRSFLVYELAHRAADLDDAAAIAASIELLHLGTLIHDDIVDQASLRRHQPSLHVAIGLPAAVWTADVLFGEAIHLAAAVTPLGGRVTCTALSRVARSQVLESQRPPLSRYWDVVDGKTGALFEACVELVDELLPDPVAVGVHDAVRAYGRLFQYLDDLNDIVGTGAIGKPLHTDVMNRLETLPLHDMAQSVSAVRERINRLVTDVISPLGNDDRARFGRAMQRVLDPVTARLDPT
jgi:heptaprenyl diphosphate synthase